MFTYLLTYWWNIRSRERQTGSGVSITHETALVIIMWKLTIIMLVLFVQNLLNICFYVQYELHYILARFPAETEIRLPGCFLPPPPYPTNVHSRAYLPPPAPPSPLSLSLSQIPGTGLRHPFSNRGRYRKAKLGVCVWLNLCLFPSLSGLCCVYR